ncbi:MAG: 4Fe-4S binding protein, partial [Candidatus Omnitrophica bacterium]|nr:4Fe-4S binding protein [Candidatus Omnitrophota bacterium]
MGAMIYRISLDPASVVHWGRVFWIMCVATTSLGLVLAIFLHQRSWCSFCPVGSVQNVLGGGKGQLKIDKDKCIECKRCEKACTLNLPIVRYKNTGIMSHRDCLKCSECIAVCPEQALSWPD